MAFLVKGVMLCIKTACGPSWHDDADCPPLCRATDRTAEDASGLSFAFRDFCCFVLLKGQCSAWNALSRASLSSKESG